MTTTIQISEDLRNNLLKYKKNSKTSYEEVIKVLLNNFKKNKKEEEKLLIKGYKEMHNLTKKMNQDWRNLNLEDMENF